MDSETVDVAPAAGALSHPGLGLPLREAGFARVNARERRWVAIFAGLVMAVTLLPYLLGYTVQGADWRFTGFMIGVEDGNSYIAKMLSSSAGAWLFRTPYTAYPQRGVLTYIPYVILGKLAAPPGLHEQLVALYQVFRMVGGFLAILATYDFLACFVQKVSLRRLGLALAILGGGLGWLLLATGFDSWLGSMPLEFYSPESFGFLGLFGLPHLALGRALMFWGLAAYLRAAGRNLDGKSALLSGLRIGLLWLATGLVQPLAGMTLGVVAASYMFGLFCWQFWLKITRRQAFQWLELRKRLFLAIGAGLVALPWVAYNFLSLELDPFLKRWTAQNILVSPHPLHYVLAYGLLALPALLGIRYLLVRLPWSGLLPITWVVALPFLAYAPTSIQRRLPDGIWVAFVILAIAGLEMLETKKVDRSVSRWLKRSSVLAFPSTLFLLVGAFLAGGRPAWPVFQPADQVAAFEELAKNAKTNQVVLAAFETGNALPAWAPLRVLIGQGPESINLAELKPRVAQFYQANTAEADRRALLNEFQVSYVFWGPAEQKLGDWDPAQANYLERLYQSDGYSIYSVSRSDDP